MDSYCRAKPTKDLLVVEDKDVIQKAYQAQFERECYTFDLVGTGKDAFAALVSTHYRLILLDAGLPDIDGNVLCRRIRHDESLGHRRQPIVMASASGNLIRSECLQAGANHFFVKTDITSEGFKETIARHIHSRA